ncbi:MAG: nuclear transport factor 2 family protein [Burkholderiaceae bacterium]
MSRAVKPPHEVRHEIADLFADYGRLIDGNRLEEWLELFTEDCDYRIVSRENVEQGLPAIIIWCDGWNMLRDRIESYRHVNEYNLHWDRHLIGPLRFIGEDSGAWIVEASYSVTQTSQESGASALFSVGVYRCRVRFDGSRARFQAVEVVADTGLIPTLLATPI